MEDRTDMPETLADDRPADEAPAPDAAAPQPSATDVLVDDWFRSHFFNLGPDLSTPAYNRLYAAAEDLKLRLRSTP